jgi:DNA-binding Xre family transcriptional regulator
MLEQGDSQPEERDGAPNEFWDPPGGLQLIAAWMQPGGRILECRFRAGPSYQVDLSELGFAEPSLFAMPDPGGEALVLASPSGGLVDVSCQRLLAACDPRYRVAPERPAVAPGRFGARARARRLAAGMSVLEAAAAAGMDPSNYVRMEAGHHRPRLDTLERVAAALGAPLGDLLDGRR